MVDVAICACGIARNDCDYHKPEQQDYVVGPLVKQIDYTYQGNGVWKITSGPNVPTGGTVTITGLTFKDPANPFFTNDLDERGKYMINHPDTWPDAVKAAGLSAPWELHKT